MKNYLNGLRYKKRSALQESCFAITKKGTALVCLDYQTLYPPTLGQ